MDHNTCIPNGDSSRRSAMTAARASLLAVSERYFAKMLVPSLIGWPPPNDRKATVAAGGGSSTEREHDNYYPQSWLVTYFALNGLRASRAMTGSGNGPLLTLDDGRAEVLANGLEKCVIRTQLPEDAGKRLGLPPWLSDTPWEAGVCPDGSAAPQRHQPSLGPTVTLTFCALQTLLNTCATSEERSILKGVADGFPKEMAVFAWRRLVAFAAVVTRAGGGTADARSTIAESSRITDPRDVYSALMTLWLVYADDKGSRDLRTLQGFLASTWDSKSGDSINVRDAILSYIFSNCYVRHEGAFGSPPYFSKGNYRTSSDWASLYATEAHTGMTYCVTASLVLLGYFECGGRTVDSAGITIIPPKDLGRSLRRYIYARQAHFGIGVSEYDQWLSSSSSSDDESSADTDERTATANPAREVFYTPGLQGRPNKDSDTCYSFWALGTMRALAVGEELMTMGTDGSNRTSTDSGRECAVSTFLGEDADHADGPSAISTTSSSSLLHDAKALERFTLMTARMATTTHQCGGAGMCCLPIAKDADEGTTPDPVHGFLGMAGLSWDTSAGDVEAPHPVFPFP